MKFKERPRGEPEPEPVELPDVRVATNRCPFCHEDVVVQTDEWVACWGCQARHHRACWQEGSRCGSCGETRFVEESPSATPTKATRGPLSVAATICGVAGLASLVAEGAFDVVILRSGLCWLLFLAWFVLGVLDGQWERAPDQDPPTS